VIKYSKTAVAAFVLSIILLFFSMIPIVGIIFTAGVVLITIGALITTSKDKNLKGRNLAITASILCAICIIITIIVNMSFFNYMSGDKAISFQGEMPELANVTYQRADGTSVAIEAYPGYVYMFVTYETRMNPVKSAVELNKGKIAAAAPVQGIYLIKTDDPAKFLKEIYKEKWFVDGMPAFPIDLAVLGLFDRFRNPEVISDCEEHHGDITVRLAKSHNDQMRVNMVDIDTDTHTFPEMALKMDQMMRDTVTNDTRLVMSFSLQSHASKLGVSAEEQGGKCQTILCQTVRDEQKMYLRMYLQTMDAMIQSNPIAAERSLMIISAGNAGVEIGIEINELRNEYPDAFKHFKIVGSSDTSGNVVKTHNFIEAPDPGIVYALGVDKPIVATSSTGITNTLLCNGTSYSTPEVAGIIENVWTRHPNLTAEQMMTVFDTTVTELGRNRVLPVDRDGRVPKSFIDRMDAIAAPAQAATQQVPPTAKEPAQVTPETEKLTKTVIPETWTGTMTGEEIGPTANIAYSYTLTLKLGSSLSDAMKLNTISYLGNGTVTGTSRQTLSKDEDSAYQKTGSLTEQVGVAVWQEGKPINIYTPTENTLIPLWGAYDGNPIYPMHGGIELMVEQSSSSSISGRWGLPRGIAPRDPHGTFTLTKTG